MQLTGFKCQNFKLQKCYTLLTLRTFEELGVAWDLRNSL
jgi:hypothetical protein